MDKRSRSAAAHTFTRSQTSVVLIYVVRFNSTYSSTQVDDAKPCNVIYQGAIQAGLGNAVSSARVGNAWLDNL
jgi:hypothetical protein